MFKVGGPDADDDRVTPDRCPACAALVPAQSAWCTLCFADLRGAGSAPTEPAADPVADVVAEPAADAGVLRAPRARGRHARRDPATAVMEAPVPSPIDVNAPATVDRVTDVDLDELDMTLLRAGEAPDPLTAWSSRLASPGARIAVIVGGIAAVGGVLLLVFTVAGLLFG